MTVYYVETCFGCGLRDQSKESIIREEGTRNISVIRPATDADIAWVSAMGGYVPETVKRKNNAAMEGI